MKAIVMAGGEGTRLRPVTSGRPKPMVELFGKPVLAHTVALLKKHGITDICFTIRYLPKVIQDYFGDGTDLGVNITYRVEEEPLGTAGGVKACVDFIDNEDFIVISGDAVCDFDLEECIRFHREKTADATLVLYEHPEPTEYGIVLTEESGRIKAFLEKPSWEHVTTNRINTGIYVLSPAVLERIPENTPYDFGKELFPGMLKENFGVFGFSGKGYWCDIGSPEAYRNCCKDVLFGEAKVMIDAPQVKSGVWSKSRILAGVEVIPPVYIGEKCDIKPGTVLGAGSVISDGSTVMEGARITGSVVNGATVEAGAQIKDSVIGKGAVIGRRAEIHEGCVIGDGAAVGAGSIVYSGIKIWTGRKVPDGRAVSRSLIGEKPGNGPQFVPKGVIKGQFPLGITAENAVAFGAVLGAIGKTGTSFTGGEAARLLAAAVGCGVCGAGGEYYELDCGFEAELSCAVRTFALCSGVFIRQSGVEITMTVYDEKGLPVKSPVLKKLEAALNSEYPVVSGASVGGQSRIIGSERAYTAEVSNVLINMGLKSGKVTAAIYGNGAENRMLRTVLSGNGADMTERRTGVPAFSVCRGGTGLAAVSEEGRSFDMGQMLAVTADAALRCGVKTLAVPESAPTAIEKLCKKYGAEFLRCGYDGERADKLFSAQLFMRDGICAAALILSAMEKFDITLSQMYAGIPRFVTAARRVDVACSRAKAMRILAGNFSETAAELICGLSVDTGRGHAHIYPMSNDSSIMIRSEGPTEQIAEQICGDIAELAGDIEA